MTDLGIQEHPPQTAGEEIHVALASDQGFFHGLKVTASSIARYASKEVILCFHILDGGINDEMFAEFALLLRDTHPRIRIFRHRLSENDFAEYPEYAGSRMTYARLLLPSLLPNVSHLVYCDCDFLWRADIAELWSEKDDSIILQSTQDGFPDTESREREWFEKHGYHFSPENYFCAGLSFYNLDLFREEKIAEQALEFLRNHQDVNCADQSAMNALLHGRVRMLPQQWQMFTCQVTREDLEGPVVLHYANELPWKRPGWWRLLTDPVMLWHRYHDTLLGMKGGSLALFFTLPEIVLKRGLDRLLCNRLFRSGFYQLLRLTGRASYRSSFDTWSRDLKLNRLR